MGFCLLFAVVSIGGAISAAVDRREAIKRYEAEAAEREQMEARTLQFLNGYKWRLDQMNRRMTAAGITESDDPQR